MYIGKDWLNAEPGEVESYTLDFTNDVNADAGEVVNSAVWTCEVVAGVDPNVSACLIGNPVITSPTATSQFFSSNVPGTTYRLRATAQTSMGQTLKLYSHVRCEVSA